MMKNRRETLLTQLAAPIVEGLGFTLWGVLAPAAGTKAVVTLFIEGPDGVNLDDCAKVSRDVGLAIEVEDAMPGAYR
ncbi:MAG: ribosome maturation factor RimP, partial [Proteobacteria bacterium]|nr:ribosome maturation factor RimP [Pseudomonadota bacterium]MBU1612304.1 ribosome maturation factor RimP [Pseudomonadota bacterium]